MQTPYTKAQIKGARKRIQNSLTGCYAGETRLHLIIGCEEHKVARAMADEPNAQIVGVKIKGSKYEAFAPTRDTLERKGFKWNK